MPDFNFEDQFQGRVCGIDEVGRGPLAGPVIASCVYIPHEVRRKDWVLEIQDSKQLTKVKRETLYEKIKRNCIFGIGIVEVEEIDRINIFQATMRAMQNAYAVIDTKMDHALIDGNKCPDLPCSTTPIVKGDTISISIAAASIIAKVSRDRLMADLAIKHPYYGWESNAGYGAKKHIEAIHANGVTEHHRRSFEPVKSLLRISTNN